MHSKLFGKGYVFSLNLIFENGVKVSMGKSMSSEKIVPC